MDDMNALEHQLATELGQMAGPGRRIDAMAMVRTVSTQSPGWRFQSMFSATKFVIAGVIVALFGGLVISGVLFCSVLRTHLSQPLPPSLQRRRHGPHTGLLRG